MPRSGSDIAKLLFGEIKAGTFQIPQMALDKSDLT